MKDKTTLRIHQHTHRLLTFVTGIWILTGCSPAGNERSGAPGNPQTAEQWAAFAQHAHGLTAWWAKEAVRADVVVDFGGNRIVDANFTFEAHGPRMRMDTVDDVSIVYDGQDAYQYPAEPAQPMGRFHVLTWPWFIYSPLKATGDGITVSDARQITVRGKTYMTFLQTFAAGEGDTPEDWYRYFIDPDTGRVEALAYIVTYGKSAQEANEQPSIVFFNVFETVDGVTFPTDMEFWYWNPDTQELSGDAPKGSCQVEAIRFQPSTDGAFALPQGKVLLPAPGAE